MKSIHSWCFIIATIWCTLMPPAIVVRENLSKPIIKQKVVRRVLQVAKVKYRYKLERRIIIPQTPIYTPSAITSLIKTLTAQAGYTSRQQEIWVQIAMAESSLNPRASNNGLYLGLFQIGTFHSCGNLFDPRTNILCAIKLDKARASRFEYTLFHVCQLKVKCK